MIVSGLILFSLFTCGIYLLLQGSLIRSLIGYLILSNAVNLSIFKFTGLKIAAPPIVDSKNELQLLNFSDPLLQAIILTAIVIGFGVSIHLVFLTLRSHTDEKTDRIDLINEEGDD